MKKVWIFVTTLILCMFLCGHGCKKAQEEPKATMKKKNAMTLEEEISKEVEKIPPPAEEWGEEAENPLLE
ncbi:MAG: hypothetical protein GKB99_00265 [Methanocellales archaeon]|nr:hypothetical protein [Methanocellales archaeon]